MKTTIKFSKRQGKYKQGEYIRLKTKYKNKVYQGMYKFKGQKGEIDAIKTYFEDKVKGKTKSKSKSYVKAFTESDVSKSNKQVEKYLKKVSKRGNLNTSIKKGIASVEIKDIKKADNKTIFDKQKELLSELVLDNKLLELIVSEENMKKMKHRFEHRIKIVDAEGKTLIEANKFNVTLTQLAKEIKKLIRDNEEVSDVSPREVTTKLKSNGYQPRFNSPGNVKRVEVQTIFRKG
jgi:hypothetical protein